MLRSIVKETAAQVASWTYVDAMARQALWRRMPYVVGYHRVVDRLDRHGAVALPAMEITLAMLERHLDWLGRHFEIVSVDDLDEQRLRQNRKKPIAVVTFDDGYADVFEIAFPL